MNKIFKVVWSKVRNCYVVVSEIAKNTVSGVGKRNRVNRLSLGATLAAAVLTSGFFLPSEGLAAENNIALAQKENYIAYQANQTEVEQYKNNLGFKNNKNYVFTKSGDQYFWVQEGYTIYTREANIVYHDGTTTTDVVYKITGEAKNSSFDAISTIQVHDDQSGVTTVLNDALDNVTLNPFGAASNSTATEVYNSYTFVLNEGGRDQVVIKTNGATDPDTGVTPEPFTKYFKTLGTNKAIGLYYDEATKTYTYKGEHVHNNSVYYINTGGGYQTGVFVINDKVYDGTVKGANGEKLLTGQIYETETDRYGNTKTTSSLVTYWGVEVENYNLTLAESKMTIGNLREAFNILKNNDDVLSRADIKRITLTPNATSNSAVIGLNYNLNEEVVPGAITITSGGGVPGNDTFVTLTNTAENGSTQTVTLKTGSVVVGNPSIEGAATTPLTSISINGSLYTLPKVETDVTDSGLVINNLGDKLDSAGRRHGWEIKDTTDNKIYADTTLVAKIDNGTYSVETESNSYTIEDTAGNKVVLNDVASASKIRTELDSYNTRITNISNDTIKNIIIDSSAKTIALIKDDDSDTAVPGTISFVTGGGTDQQDTFVKISNAQNSNGIVLNTGSKVEALTVNDTKRLDGLRINGEIYDIPSWTEIGEAITIQDYYLKNGEEDISDIEGVAANTEGYIVGENGVIELKVENDGTAPKSVYIADVAKYSDVGDVDELQRYADSYQISNNVTTHIDNLYEEVTNARIEASKHNVVSGSKNIEVTKFQDGRNYNVTLKDNIVLGDLDKDDSQIILEGDNGYIFARRHDNTRPEGEELVGEITIDASKNEVRVGLEGGNQVIVNGGEVAEVTGLTNKTLPWDDTSWKSVGRAATEEQLQIVANNDIESIRVISGDNSGSIDLLRKSKTNGDNNDVVPGGLSFTSGVGTSGNQVITISGDGSGEFTLDAGSVVSANQNKAQHNEGDPLEDITINGKKYSVATSASVNAAKTVVKAAENKSGVFSVTDVTQSGDANNTYIINVNDMHVESGVASYEDDGVGSAILTHKDTVEATITGLKNNYIKTAGFDTETGILSLAYNDSNLQSLQVTGLMSGWTATVGNETITVGNKGNIDFVAGKNIELDVDGDVISVATVSDVVFDSVTVNGSANGNNIVINSNGINAGDYRITNVADGIIDQDSTDAVNGGQLWTTQQYDIDRIRIGSSVDGGVNDTIGLIRTSGDDVNGTLKITSGGGTWDSEQNKHVDTYVTITQNGANANAIVLNTGSKVSANPTGAITGEIDFLDTIIINGHPYKIHDPEEYLFNEYGDRLTDYHLVNGAEHLGVTEDGQSITGYKVGEDGIVVLNVYDKHVEEGDTAHHHAHVRIADVASKTQQDINTAKLTGTVMYDENQNGTYNYSSIKLGETGSNINGTATAEYQKNTDGTYTGGVNVTNVAYAVTDKTDTANYDGSAAVNVDLLNDKISAVQTIAEKQTTLSDGKNINVESTTSNSVTNYTVNLEDNITLGDANNTNVNINGDAGSITAITKDGNNTTGQISIDSANNRITVGVGGTNNQVVIDGGSGTVTGLTNTTWSGDVEDVVANRAATEGQLQALQNSFTTTVAQQIDGIVKYDRKQDGTVDKTKVTLEGSDGTLITNLSKGNVSENSTDAINGSQLYAVEQKVDSNTSRISTNETNIANLQNDVAKGWNAQVNGVQVKNVQMGDDLNFSQGNNIVINGTNGVIEVSTATDVKFEKVTVGDVVVDSNGIDAGSKKITNVAAGTEDTDAVNVKQLKEANAHASFNTQHIQNLYGQDQHLNSRINQVNSRVNKVGAGAAALAALHPMDFDPDDKLSFAVGAGNYAGENATAIGAFYRPNEKVMMSVGGTYGNGENMVNMGLSFALDKTNNVSNSRTAMAREIVDLREQVATQGQQIAQLVALVQQLAGVQQPVVPADQLFPDIPENHWAYEYIHGLAAKGIVEGYPDGNFGGDRTMTRYEFAAMLFRALEKGVVLSEQIRKEFEPELGRIRVDRVKGADADLNKIERVRVNTAADRDDYGSKVVQVKH